MLALWKIKSNGVLKKILFCDLGDVLMRFEERRMRALIKDEKFENFLSMIHDHDRGNSDFELFDLHLKLRLNEYYRWNVSWGDLVLAYARCIDGVHWPMFDALKELKSKRVKIVCLTDINHFCFYVTSIKFPEICDLFYSDEGKENWALSYRRRTLKRDPGCFSHLPTEFGIGLADAAFVDNMPLNLEMAQKAGIKKDACFLYDRFNPKNHQKFLKFLKKHFP